MPHTNIVAHLHQHTELTEVKRSLLCRRVSSQTSWYLLVLLLFDYVRLLASWEWDSPLSPCLCALFSLFFFWPSARKAAELKTNTELWDEKKNEANVQFFESGFLKSHLSSHMWKRKIVFVSVIIIRPKPIENMSYMKGRNTYSAGIELSCCTAQLLCGHVYSSELVKWCTKSSSRGVVIYVYFPLIGFSLGGGMLCAHRAAGSEVKDTTNPHETLPYICLLLRPSTRPPNTHIHTNRFTFRAYAYSQTIILIVPD